MVSGLARGPPQGQPTGIRDEPKVKEPDVSDWTTGSIPPQCSFPLPDYYGETSGVRLGGTHPAPLPARHDDGGCGHVTARW